MKVAVKTRCQYEMDGGDQTRRDASDFGSAIISFNKCRRIAIISFNKFRWECNYRLQQVSYFLFQFLLIYLILQKAT